MSNYDLTKPENRIMLAIPLAAYAIGIAALEMGWLPDTTLINLFLGLIRLFIIYIIAKNGTTLKTRPYAQLFSLLASVVIVGVLFKILHWTGANSILLGGFFAFAALYTVRFILKPTHKLTDFLKWLWVLIEATAIAFKISHWKYGDELVSIEQVVFLALVFSVYYDVVLKKRKVTSGNS
jgi:hypothetical protein